MYKYNFPFAKFAFGQVLNIQYNQVQTVDKFISILVYFRILLLKTIKIIVVLDEHGSIRVWNRTPERNRIKN